MGLGMDYSEISTTMQAEKAYWQFNMAGTLASVYLEEVTTYALEFASRNENGFVMMLEQAHVDKYSHSGDFVGMRSSVDSLNNTVEVIMDWIGDRTDTAVLITADHETGGLKISDGDDLFLPFKTKNGSTASYMFTSTGHTQTPVGLFTYNIAPKFKKMSFYSSKDMIKNIETYQIMSNLLQNPTAY
jgi:alkaline phosphatase